ncbi:hypothetical protein [Streptomyces solaniscabiei]|nr:hypothetical protein [Streptomyces solaniscabiei]
MKTGSGPEAGYCLAFSATRSGKTVYGGILAPHQRHNPQGRTR